MLAPEHRRKKSAKWPRLQRPVALQGIVKAAASETRRSLKQWRPADMTARPSWLSTARLSAFGGPLASRSASRARDLCMNVCVFVESDPCAWHDRASYSNTIPLTHTHTHTLSQGPLAGYDGLRM